MNTSQLLIQLLKGAKGEGEVKGSRSVYIAARIQHEMENLERD
jgi:hypothetical protein